MRLSFVSKILESILTLAPPQKSSGKQPSVSVPKQGFAVPAIQSRVNTYLGLILPWQRLGSGFGRKQNPAGFMKGWSVITTKSGQYFTDHRQQPSRKRKRKPQPRLCADWSIALNEYLTYHTASHYQTRKSRKSTRQKCKAVVPPTSRSIAGEFPARSAVWAG